MNRERNRRVAGVLVVAALIASCSCPPLRPDFAGVPDATVRSADCTLPLGAADRAALLGYLVKKEGVRDDPDSEQEIARRYASVLDALAAGPDFDALAAETGALRKAAGADWRMHVNDAREKVRLDVTNSFAILGGGFAWVVYRHQVGNPAGAPAVVVFPSQFVLTSPAR